MGIVKAVCLSEKRGTRKKDVLSGVLVENHGLQGDAHAGEWHRQISLLSEEKIVAFRSKGVDVQFGDFGENIVVSGIDFAKLPIGTRFAVNGAILEMTQIGKECHSDCEIRRITGDCIMPREGVFAKVIKGDAVSVDDEFKIITYASIVTVSDSTSMGTRVDESGPALKALLEREGYQIDSMHVVPDDEKTIADLLTDICQKGTARLLLTTGGTGFSVRDVTPEATLSVIQRAVPGIPEAMRAASLAITPRAMLSRAAAGIRERTLIINLPGSVKGATESLSAVLPALGHGLDILTGSSSDCARKP